MGTVMGALLADVADQRVEVVRGPHQQHPRPRCSAAGLTRRILARAVRPLHVGSPHPSPALQPGPGFRGTLVPRLSTQYLPLRAEAGGHDDLSGLPRP